MDITIPVHGKWELKSFKEVVLGKNSSNSSEVIVNKQFRPN